jgi:hypothetical protein
VPTDQTWTSYSSGGNLYLYELGAPEAQLLWEPTGELAQACDSPVISDAAGALYYLNDSGYVAKLIPVEPEQEPEPENVDTKPEVETPKTPSKPEEDKDGRKKQGLNILSSLKKLFTENNTEEDEDGSYD